MSKVQLFVKIKKSKAIWLFVIILLSASNSFAQKASQLSWQTLSDVKFDMVWHPEIKAHKMIPTFGEKVKKVKGKLVEISGYAIPYRIEEGNFVLSANPNSSCFFCGRAGPESVLSLKFLKPNKSLTVDDYIKVRGVFRVNQNNEYDLYYIIDKAEIVK